MRPVSIVLFSLIAGFLAGHGFELAPDLVPLVLTVTVGFLALSATGLLYEHD